MIKSDKERKEFQTLQKKEKNILLFGIVFGCDDECGDIHGDEFSRESEFHCEYHRSHIEENVRHICKISGRTR